MANGMLTLEELKKEVAAGTIDTVVAAMVDMQGRLIGKRFHAQFFADGGYEETHGCNYLLGVDIEMEPVPGYKATSWEKGYGDFVLKPDMATLRRTPWLPGTALVLCDVLDHHTHEDMPHSPRAILKKQLKRLEAMKMKAYMASELEFFLFDDSYETAHHKGYRHLKTAGYYIEDYHILQTTKEEGYMRALRNGLQAPAFRSKIPRANGARARKKSTSNMPRRWRWPTVTPSSRTAARKSPMASARPSPSWPSGTTAWPAIPRTSTSPCGRPTASPLFLDKTGEHGMSEMMKHYLAGQLAHAGEITYFLAPYINSYKRFMAGTFAPTRAVWSFDNRTAGFRLCGADTKAIRVECRVGGADLNPYLAFAALLAAGLDGIEKKMELEPVFPAMPMTPRASCAKFPRRCARRPRCSTAPSSCAVPWAMMWSTTMCTRRSGSSSNSTGASPILN